ncbi:MAG: pyridoxamine kinase [Clostridia bacterium]|nr:pyridoxamine kinase [Clostridia bacterium]
MKRILTVQDISCVGRCSLTVALPIISAAGVEAGVLPTAVLSTHTAFPKFTFCDLTDEIEGISKTFSELELDFDAIYTGYLGSFRQLGLVSELIDRHKTEKCMVVIDPCMADNGKLYKGFTPEFAKAMAGLCGKADLIVPNLTEACFMLGIPYTEDYDEEYIRKILKQLTALGAKRAALTGISFDPSKLGAYSYDSTTDSYFSCFNDRLPVAYHGTGDIFASATLGALMRGHTTESALSVAVDYTLECIRLTMADEDRRTYGVNFEQALPYYIDRLEIKK